MIKLRLPLTGLMLAAMLMFNGCSKDEDSSNTTSNDPKRDQAVSDYQTMYLASALTDTQLGWTGATGTCTEGTISQEALDKSLLRINYFRKICGLPYDMTWDTTKFNVCQKTSLMCDANNTLSHNPPATWTCYSAEGAAAASKSNLALGYHSVNALSAWIEDGGSNNLPVGHRRWMIYSRANRFSIGSTKRACTLYCIGLSASAVPAGTPPIICYPPAYVPQELAYDRWSMAVVNAATPFSGVDFTNSTVTVTDPGGQALTVNVVSRNDNGYGDQTIVFEPQGVITNAPADLKYHVKVANVVVNGSSKDYEYDVNIIKP